MTEHLPKKVSGIKFNLILSNFTKKLTCWRLLSKILKIKLVFIYNLCEEFTIIAESVSLFFLRTKNV